MALTRLEKAMAILTVFAMRLVKDDEDDPVMSPELDWADPQLWAKSCITYKERMV